MKIKKRKTKKILKSLKKKISKKKVIKKRTAKKRIGKVKALKSAAPAYPTEHLQEVGKIAHYFPKVKAGVIKITNGRIAVGDTLYIKGHTTDFRQPVASIQIDHVPVKEAGKGQEIGLLVKSRVRVNDAVYKI